MTLAMALEKLILVIEDDAHIAELLEIHLKDHGFELSWAQDGLAGLQKFRENVCEMEAWHHADLFLLGGGSLIESLVEIVSIHPSTKDEVKVRRLQVPPDLTLEDGSPVRTAQLPFCS